MRSNNGWAKKVPVATIGTILYDATGVAFTIKKGKFVDKKVTE
jgi:phenylalanyl-tRNA synthetase beta chain